MKRKVLLEETMELGGPGTQRKLNSQDSRQTEESDRR